MSVVGPDLVEIDLDALERVGTALADGVRRAILAQLLAGPAYPSELAQRLGEGRANISNHLACLRGCGLVTTTREGRRVRYELSHPDLTNALKLLAAVPLVPEPGHADLDGRA